ncbi:MAG: hypothetical protein IK013_04430 [Bacteroidales bacterium]|nr:hypothetical protein [Bacteroidales bacterium]
MMIRGGKNDYTIAIHILLLWWVMMGGENESRAQMDTRTVFLLNSAADIPAAYCFIPASTISLGVGNDFCTKEMTNSVLRGTYARNGHNLLLSLSHYGYHAFGKMTMQAGYGKCFGGRVAVSLQGVYLMQHARHYGCQHSVTFALSFYYAITEKMSVGVAVFNPAALKYGVVGHETIPIRFYLQIGYLPDRRLAGSLFCEKTLPGPFNAGIRLLYHPIPNLFLETRCGFSCLSFHTSVPWRKFRFGCSAQWNYKIGFSPACQIDCVF